jgi:hypothetical protein
MNKNVQEMYKAFSKADGGIFNFFPNMTCTKKSLTPPCLLKPGLSGQVGHNLEIIEFFTIQKRDKPGQADKKAGHFSQREQKWQP